MAQRMVIVRPTRPSSLRTALKELVCPVLAMNALFASSFSKLMELKAAAATPSCSQPGSSEVGKKCDSNVTLTDGLLEISNKYWRENPGKPLEASFRFSADPTIEDVNKFEHPRTLTWTIPCARPPSNLKYLTAAIENGFGPRLGKVAIVVNENKLEMWYDTRLLVSSKVEAAESLIKYAVQMVRNRWLRLLQLKLLEKYEASRVSRAWKFNCGHSLLSATDAKLREIEIKRHEAVAKCVNKALKYTMQKAQDLRRQELSTHWGKKLTEELVQHQLEASFRKNTKDLVEFKCSGSSTKTICWSGPDCFARLIKDYVRSQLRKQTSPNSSKRVIIRMTNERDDDFLNGPPSHDTFIMQNTGAAEETWVSISDDAEGPEPRRVIICRARNFTAALSDFLKTTDIGQFTSLKGYERVDSGISEFLPNSDCELPDLSRLCPEELAKLMTEGSGSP